MRTRLAYGKTGLDIDLPDDAPITVIEPRYLPGLPDPAAALHAALRSPIGAQPLRTLVGPSDTVGIVFSDITRPTPHRLLLPAILAELEHLPDAQIVLFNATGTHRANTEAELRGMLGDQVVDRYRIVQNDCTDRETHVSLGTTRSGNEIWIQREFVECDKRILTGFIEPHLFAGFSGGGKAVMPGLALLETVMRNHSVRHIDSPLATWGITEGNPLWEEVREAARLVQPLFLLNVTLNRDKQITAVFAGAWEEAHARGCQFVKQTAMVAVPSPFDIVITTNSGYPLDLNLYQTVKGMSAAAQVVRPGGSIVAAAQCWDGIPDHGEYAQMLHEADSSQSLLQTIRRPGYQRHDMWEAQVQALVLQKADVYVHSDGLSDAQIREALLTPCRDIEACVAALRRKYGPECRICVLPEGPQTIPYILKQSAE
jgi:nickel-dependent lactate racemase